MAKNGPGTHRAQRARRSSMRFLKVAPRQRSDCPRTEELCLRIQKLCLRYQKLCLQKVRLCPLQVRLCPLKVRPLVPFWALFLDDAAV